MYNLVCERLRNETWIGDYAGGGRRKIMENNLEIIRRCYADSMVRR